MNDIVKVAELVDEEAVQVAVNEGIFANCGTKYG